MFQPEFSQMKTERLLIKVDWSMVLNSNYSSVDHKGCQLCNLFTVVISLIEIVPLGDCCPEKAGLLLATVVLTACAQAIVRVKFRMTLRMASAGVVGASVANGSPFHDFGHPDDHFQSRYATPQSKPFS